MARVVDTKKVAEAIGYCTMQDLLELAVHLHESMGGRAYGNFVNILKDQLNDPDRIPDQLYAIRMTLNPQFKIQMIKLVREIQGSGLKEAKQFVDQAVYDTGLGGMQNNPDNKYVDVITSGDREKLVAIVEPILRRGQEIQRISISVVTV